MSIRSPLKRVALAGMVLLSALCGGYVWYWNQLANGLEDGLEVWLAQRRADGFRTDTSPMTLSGFPFSVQAQIKNLHLIRGVATHPAYWSWQARDIHAEISPFDPLQIHLQSKAPHKIEFIDRAGKQRKISVAAKTAEGFLELSTDGRLATLQLNLQAFILSGKALIGPVLADHIQAHVDLRNGTTVDLQSNNLLVPEQLNPLFGPSVSVLRLQATIHGPLPLAWSRPVITAWREMGGTVELTRVRVKWGDLDLTAKGNLALDDQMRPEGSGTAAIRGHSESLKSLADRDVITPTNAAVLTIALNMLGRKSDGTVNMPLSARNGKVQIGPITALNIRPLTFPN